MRRYGFRILFGLAYTTVILLHVTGIVRIPVIERLEHIAYDARVKFGLLGEIDPRVVIVDIDERSLSAEGQWPWRRDRLALLVERLIDRYHADMVAFDILFAEPQESHDLTQVRDIAAARGDQNALKVLNRYAAALERDRIFAESLSARRVLLGYFFHTDPSLQRRIGKLPPPVFDGDGSEVGLDAVNASGYSANIPLLQDAAAGAGFFSNPIVDSDGIFRRVPLLHEYQGALYESLALAVARHYLGLDLAPGFADAPGGSGDKLVLEYLNLGPIRIPIDQNGAVLVPYRSVSPGFPYISATDILNDDVSSPEVLDSAIVLVGTTAAGLVDHRPTPVENVFPGVEVHANVVSGILDETIKWRPSYTVAAETVTVALFGVIGSLLLPPLSPIVASAATWLLIGANTGVNLYLWRYQSHLLPIVSSLLLLLGLYVMNMFHGFFVESRTRAQLRGLFGQYVPPELVDEMNKDPGRYTVDSEKRELTVLFTDVRDFTTISESLEPEKLAALMNEFLTPMTRIVHGHRGTIDKYMGDAMMAFWGAPVADPEHAARAVQAALDMVAALDALRDTFTTRGWPPVRIGVGINTGPMNVGNMGS